VRQPRRPSELKKGAVTWRIQKRTVMGLRGQCKFRDIARLMSDLQRPPFCPDCGGQGTFSYIKGYGKPCSRCKGTGIIGAYLTHKELTQIIKIGPDRWIRECADDIEKETRRQWDAINKGWKRFNREALRDSTARQILSPTVGEPGDLAEFTAVVVERSKGYCPGMGYYQYTEWKTTDNERVWFFGELNGIEVGHVTTIQCVVRSVGFDIRTTKREAEVMFAEVVSCTDTRESEVAKSMLFPHKRRMTQLAQVRRYINRLDKAKRQAQETVRQATEQEQEAKPLHTQDDSIGT
jgi:hypothetical protein